MRRQIAVIVIAACLLAVALPYREYAHAAQAPNKDPGLGLGALAPGATARVRQAIAAVGLILVRNDGDPQALRPRGSAVVVRADGVIATNLHVITDERTNQPYDELVLNLPSDNPQSPGANGRYRLRAALTSKEYDLALLRIEPDAAGVRTQPLPVLEIGDSRGVQLLDDLIVIGFPEKGGTTVTVSRGVVEGKDPARNWIKTDARVLHGNSGGAAVGDDGKLIGIPTKVVADVQPVEKNKDGSSGGVRLFGAVGFLRPAHLVANMLRELDGANADPTPAAPAPPAAPAQQIPTPQPKSMPKPAAPEAERRLKIGVVPPSGTTSGAVKVSGAVRASQTGAPIAGAIIGILAPGATQATESTLLAWGSSNSDGRFELNHPVPPGRYTLRAKALGRESYTRDIEIAAKPTPLVVEMTPK